MEFGSFVFLLQFGIKPTDCTFQVSIFSKLNGIMVRLQFIVENLIIIRRIIVEKWFICILSHPKPG